LEIRARSGLMALRIAIDARRIGDFGVGTYLRNLISRACKTGSRESLTS